jgi:hypothetical protein
MASQRASFWTITLETVVVHTLRYIVIGILASTLFDYASALARPGYSAFMRQMDEGRWTVDDGCPGTGDGNSRVGIPCLPSSVTGRQMAAVNCPHST